MVDLRELNKAVQRQTFQIPRLDDMLPLLTNSKLFSSLDGVSGYLQTSVHTDSQELLTFSTPFGRDCFQRLSFGICSAPKLYQMLVSQLLGAPERATFNGNVVLTAIDYFSRYPFAFVLKNGTSNAIVKCLHNIVSHFGLPEAITSDNGTPFTSTEFTGFLHRLGIRHNKSFVYFLQANGLVQRFSTCGPRTPKGPRGASKGSVGKPRKVMFFLVIKYCLIDGYWRFQYQGKLNCKKVIFLL